MTYIWDQKPKLEEVYVDTPDPDNLVHYYSVEEMDAWLETVKLLYEALSATVIEQGEILGTIKTHIEEEIEFHAPDMVEGAWLNEHFEAILKILGVES